MDLNILWFVLIVVLFTGFFFLEGFDHGGRRELRGFSASLRDDVQHILPRALSYARRAHPARRRL